MALEPTIQFYQITDAGDQDLRKLNESGGPQGTLRSDASAVDWGVGQAGNWFKPIGLAIHLVGNRISELHYHMYDFQSNLETFFGGSGADWDARFRVSGEFTNYNAISPADRATQIGNNTLVSGQNTYGWMSLSHDGESPSLLHLTPPFPDNTGTVRGGKTNANRWFPGTVLTDSNDGSWALDTALTLPHTTNATRHVGADDPAGESLYTPADLDRFVVNFFLFVAIRPAADAVAGNHTGFGFRANVKWPEL